MLQYLLNLSILITVTIPLLLLLKRLLKNRVSSRFQLLLWGVLLLQLALYPLSNLMPASDVSVQRFLPSAQKETAALSYIESGTSGEQKNFGTDRTETGTAESGIQETAMASEKGGQESEAALHSEKSGSRDTSSASDTIHAREIRKTSLQVRFPGGRQVSFPVARGKGILAGWLMGALLLLFLEGLRCVKLKKAANRWTECGDPGVLAIFEECKKQLGIEREIGLKTDTDRTMLMGIKHPTVFVEKGFEKGDLKYIFLHELCHYKHRDIELSLAGTVCLAIFWFHPLMHRAFRIFQQDIEMACDERAAGVLGDRRGYASVLVRSASGKPQFVAATTSFFGGKKEVAERVSRLAEFRRPRIAVRILAAGLAFLLLAACTTAAPKEEVPASVSVVIGVGRQADVPLAWLSDMRTADGSKSLPAGGKQFFDADGKLFAEVYSGTGEFLTAEEWMGFETSSVYPGISRDKAEEIFRRHFGERRFTEIEKLSESSGSAPNEFLFRAEKDGAEYLLSASRQDLVFQVALMRSGETGSGDDAALLQGCLAGSRDYHAEDGDAGGVFLDTVTENKRGIFFGNEGRKISGREFLDLADEALRLSLDQVQHADLPVEKKISGYRILSMREISTEKARPDMPNIALGAFYDAPRWDVIYPGAKLIEAEYEVTPHLSQYFTGKTTEKRLGVFAVNDYVAPEEAKEKLGQDCGEFYFIGFVPEGTEELDSKVLEMLENWYTRLNPMVPSVYGSKYLGNAPAVGRMVGALPLHEYIDGSEGSFSSRSLELQTAQEPYGLTIHYTFPEKPEQNTDEIAMSPVDERSRAILDTGINAYVGREIYRNIDRLFAGIENLGEVTMVLHYPENGVWTEKRIEERRPV